MPASDMKNDEKSIEQLDDAEAIATHQAALTAALAKEKILEELRGMFQWITKNNTPKNFYLIELELPGEIIALIKKLGALGEYKDQISQIQKLRKVYRAIRKNKSLQKFLDELVDIYAQAAMFVEKADKVKQPAWDSKVVLASEASQQWVKMQDTYQKASEEYMRGCEAETSNPLLLDHYKSMANYNYLCNNIRTNVLFEIYDYLWKAHGGLTAAQQREPLLVPIQQQLKKRYDIGDGDIVKAMMRNETLLDLFRAKQSTYGEEKSPDIKAAPLAEMAVMKSRKPFWDKAASKPKTKVKTPPSRKQVSTTEPAKPTIS